MQKIFAVYDSKSEAYDRPWTSPSRGIALRSIMDVLKDPNHPFSKWPGDFTLFEIAEYDEHTGTIMPHAAKVNLGVMLELRENLGNSEIRAESNRTALKTVSETQEGDTNHVQ